MKLKVRSAIFHAPTAEHLSSVEIIFENGRDAWLNNDIKITLLRQGIVCLDFRELPSVYFKDGENRIELTGCTRNKAVAAIARTYAKYLYRGLVLRDGQEIS